MSTSGVVEGAEALSMARAVAAEAAALLRTGVSRVGAVRSKSSARDLVTEWDTRCEDLIRERLHALTPGIPILGEEGGMSSAKAAGEEAAGHQAGAAGHAGAGDERWLVDPIDGTINFTHGLPLFAVVIALERRGQPIVGVVHAPLPGWEFHGHAGGGAFLNGERLTVSRTDRIEAAMVATGFPDDLVSASHGNNPEWSHFQGRAGACRCLGSAALQVCMVACGWLDAFWERSLHPWDVAAGALLVKEAGGRVTSVDGAPFASNRGEILASNGVIHGEMLDELGRIRPQPGSPHEPLDYTPD